MVIICSIIIVICLACITQEMGDFIFEEGDYKNKK